MLTLYFRQDNNVTTSIKNMIPDSRAKEALFDPMQDIIFTPKASCLLACNGIGNQELIAALENEGDVELGHDSTDVHVFPKRYYIEVPIGTKNYYVIVKAVLGQIKGDIDHKEIKRGQTFITNIGLIDQAEKCACDTIKN